MLNLKLLEIIACPKCKEEITFDKPNNELVCNKCRLAYPIVEDIPIMLITKARDLNNG